MRVFLSTLLLTLTAGLAVAADRNETVQFKPGATGASLSGSIAGYNGVNYHLGAKAGQVMTVKLQPSNGACYMNVWAPGTDTVIHAGDSTGNAFAGKLTAAGDYRVQVYLMRSAALRGERCNYVLTVDVR